MLCWRLADAPFPAAQQRGEGDGLYDGAQRSGLRSSLPFAQSAASRLGLFASSRAFAIRSRGLPIFSWVSLCWA